MIVPNANNHIVIDQEIDNMTHLTPNALRVYVYLVRRSGAMDPNLYDARVIGLHCFQSVTTDRLEQIDIAREAMAELRRLGLVTMSEIDSKKWGLT